LLEIQLDWKAEDSSHIQTLGARRRASRDQFWGYGAVSAPRAAIEDHLHFRRVPRHDDIGEQAQRVGDGLHFILALGLIIGDAADIDQALQGVGCFAAIEHA